MPTDEIIVKYTADVSDLEKQLANIQEAQEKLGIQSKKTGDQINKGFRGGKTEIQANKKSVEELEKTLGRLERARLKATDPAIEERYRRQILRTRKQIEANKRAIDNNTKSVKKAATETRKLEQNTRKYGRELKRTNRESSKLAQTFRRVGVAIATAFSIQQLVEFGKQSIEVARELEAIGISIEFIEGSVEQGIATQEFLSRITKDLGLELVSTTEAYKQFAGAARLAGTSTAETQEIFLSVSKAVTAMGLSAAQADRVFLALSQIISKGVVSAEELRRQLGDALPGAFSIAAQSAGKTEAEFNKLLETGQVISKDFLPGFAALLGETLGAGAAEGARSLNAEFNRLQNEITAIQRKLGNDLAPVWIKVKREFLSGLSQMIESTKRLGELIVAISEFDAEKIIEAIKNFTQAGRKAIQDEIEKQGSFFDRDKLEDAISEINDILVKRRKELRTEKLLVLKQEEKDIEDAFKAEEISAKQRDEKLEAVSKKRLEASKRNAEEELNILTNLVQERESLLKDARDKVLPVPLIISDDETGQTTVIKTFGELTDEIERVELALTRAKSVKPFGTTEEEAFKTEEALQQYRDEVNNLTEDLEFLKSQSENVTGGFFDVNDVFRFEAQLRLLKDQLRGVKKELAPDLGTAGPTKEAIDNVKKLQKAFKKLGELRLSPQGIPDTEQAKKLADEIVKLSEESGQSIRQSWFEVLTANGVATDSFLADMVLEYIQFSEKWKNITQDTINGFDEVTGKTKSGVEVLADAFSRELDLLRSISLEVIAIFGNVTEARIQELEKQKRIVDENLSREREQLTEDRQNRLITEKEYQQGLDRLDAERNAKEEKLRQEQQKLRNRQALAEKAFAIFEISLNTAVAVTSALRSVPPNVALATLIAALGAAQIVSVSTQPVPQFAKGTKGKKDSGMAVVGEKGEETVWLPQGAKVLPNKQHQEHGQVLDAMYDNKFEDYVYKNYITPALLEQKRSYESQQQESFANNVAESVVFNAGITYNEAKRINAKGTKLNNIDELAEAIAEKLEVNYRRV